MYGLSPGAETVSDVRATKCCEMIPDNWALCEKPDGGCEIRIGETSAELINGGIRAEISRFGKIMIYNGEGKLLLEDTRETEETFWMKSAARLKLRQESSNRLSAETII